MTPRKKGTGVRNLVLRGGRYYVHLRHAKLGRLFKSLGTADEDVALTNLQAVRTLLERGDFGVVKRFGAGELSAAELASAVREGDYRRLRRLNADGLLLGPYAEVWIARLEATKAPNTVRNHSAALSTARAEFGEDFPLADLTMAEAEAFLHRERDGETWATATQSFYRTVLGAVWQHAIDRQAEEAERTGAAPVLVSNPWRRAEIRTARPERQSVLSEEELRDLINRPEIAGTAVRAFLALAGWVGLRQMEILHLRPGIDVVLDGDPMIRIQPRKGEYPWKPKSANSVRDVRITGTLVEILKSHQERLAGRRYLFRQPGHDRPYTGDTAIRWTKAAFTAAGIRYGRNTGDGLTLHSLRHTHASILLSNGVPIPAVAQRLGDSVKVVVNTYAHFIPSDEARVLQAVEAMASGRSDGA